MKTLEALRHLAAIAMMGTIAWVTVDFYRSLDRRQTELESRVSKKLDAIEATIEKDLQSQVQAELHPISAQAAGLLSDVRAKINTLDIDGVNRTVAGAGAAIAPLASAAHQLDAALPDFLDCQQDATGVGNKGCLYYRYSDLSRSADVTRQAIANAAPGIARSAQTTSEAVAKAAPSLASSAAGVAASANSIGKTADKALTELTKPKTLRQKVEAWVKFGVYTAARFL